MPSASKPKNGHHIIIDDATFAIIVDMYTREKLSWNDIEARTHVGRGPIIQEEPLYRALKEGWIAGAGLDVWWSEPWWNPSAKSSQTQPYEFWKLPNVIATPHNIALTDAGMDAELRLAVENIRRVSEGKPAINEVNKELQY